jgi:hypothetical protein
MASGMPWPLIFDVPYLAMKPTMIPPITGVMITHGPRWFRRALVKVASHRW